MTLSAKIKASAAKQIPRLDVGTCRRRVEQTDRLATDLHVGTVLTGKRDGLSRLRVCAYRIAFELRN